MLKAYVIRGTELPPNTNSEFGAKIELRARSWYNSPQNLIENRLGWRSADVVKYFQRLKSKQWD